MGAYTPNAKVWYPTGTDSAKLDTLLSTMASSIEDGLQPRLAQQEIAVGLKASASSQQPINQNAATVTYAVGAGYGQFNNGFTFSGGIATVKTAGQYLVAALVGVQPNNYSNTRSVVSWVYHNSDPVAYCETPMSNNYTVSAQATVVMNCVAGDTIYVQASTGGGSTSGVLLNNAPYCTTLSIALVKASPA